MRTLLPLRVSGLYMASTAEQVSVERISLSDHGLLAEHRQAGLTSSPAASEFFGTPCPLGQYRPRGANILVGERHRGFAISRPLH